MIRELAEGGGNGDVACVGMLLGMAGCSCLALLSLSFKIMPPISQWSLIIYLFTCYMQLSTLHARPSAYYCNW